jgi:hypothetical protein
VSSGVKDTCYTSNIQPYSQIVAIFICNLGHWHLCYLPLVGIGKFENRLTLLGPKSKTRFLFQIRSEAIGKIEKGLKDDEHHNIIGYTVIDGDRQTHYDSSWNRTGYTTSEETKDTHYDIDQNRIGHTDRDNDDTGSHYDKNHNRTGYSKKYKDKEVMFDKSWNRKGYKK